ncbi:hypothetical protein AKO1_006505 [Acrasis kona]|uniref:Protein FAM91A1 n=1 Tax=Acrasis kona TaxID=1008807 RepID=A0AAW2ZLP8_9EUKA
MSVKDTLGKSQQVYQDAVRTFSMSRQLSYEVSPTRFIMKKDEYYTEMVEYLKNELRMFPYQFADTVVNKLNVLPFVYYTDMMFNIMKNEKSYDTLPNFTAADINILMGIGRNQYIDIMNKARSQKWTWRFNKSIVKTMLPQEPLEIEVQYWWIIEIVPMPQQEFLKIYQTMTEDEALAVSIVKSEGKVLACRIPYDSLISIYRKGLVHIHVPINDSDQIILPPLKNFIMNRTPNDHFEKLLYDILVSIDERTTVSELANILDLDVESIKNAVSVCCRLGFAKKKMPKPHNLNDTSEDQYHNTWQDRINKYHDSTTNRSQSVILNSPSQIESAFDTSTTSTTGGAKSKRIGFMFDSSLAAYLMMGNLGEGLKNHAVTLFEVGKMSDESMDDFLYELDQVKSTGEGEGEARRYYRHAIALRYTLRFLRRNERFRLTSSDGGVDMVRSESLNNLDNATKMRILETNYAVMIAMAPLAAGTLTLPSCIPRFYGPPIPHVSSPWFKMYLYDCCGAGPFSMLLVKGQRIRKLHPLLRECDRVMLAGWEQEPNHVNTRVLLQVLNENLQTSPNLVQVCDPVNTANHAEDHDDAPNNVQQDTFDVCFPYERNYTPTISVINDPDDQDEYDHKFTEEQLDQIDTIMTRVTERLHLESSFGCVRMMRAGDGKIKPIELFFGIPLSHKYLSQRVCDGIVKNDLFSVDNLEKHTMNMRLMCKEFLSFVDAQLDSKLRFDEDNVYPTRNIVFNGESTHFL